MVTYVSLTNELLRRLNEVPLDIAGDGFDTVRNVQALAKDSVNSSIRLILQDGREWHFLKKTYTQTLSVGTRTYSFPTDTSTVDWDSFYLKKTLRVSLIFSLTLCLLYSVNFACLSGHFHCE